MRVRPVGLLVVVGAQGMVAQLVILRELLAGFAGNELAAGVLLGAWVGAEALGAWLAGRARPSAANRILVPAAIAVCVASLLAPAIAVAARRSFGVLPGETANPLVMLAVTMAAVLVPALAHGALFVTCTSLLVESQTVRKPDSQTAGQEERQRAGQQDSRTAEQQSGQCEREFDSQPAPLRAVRLSAVGSGYFLEGAGTALAGIAVWLAMAGGVNSFLLLGVFCPPLLVLAGDVDRRPVAIGLTLVATVLLVVVSLFGARLETGLWQRYWPGQRVKQVENTAIGKLVTLERSGQQMVMQDGVPVYSSPIADRAAAEELAHLPLLSLGRPGKVLVVGPGFELVPELVKHNPSGVTLVQPDARLARAVLSSDSALADILRQPGVRLVNDDPRRFLTATRERFDVVIITQATPHSLAGTRLSTSEFFRRCRSRMTEDGVLAIAGAGPADVRLAAQAQLSRTRYATLSSAFPYVKALPADVLLFLAGDGQPEVRPDTLATRLEHSGIATSVLTPSYLTSLLMPFRQERLDTLLAEAGRVSTDARPLELAEAMALAAEIQVPWLAKVQRAVEKRLAPVLAAALTLLAVLAVWGGVRRGASFARPLAVFGSGLAGAGVSVLGVFAYQVRFGSAYSELGMLFAAFMLGTVLGGVVGTMLSGRREAGLVFVLAQALLAGCAAAVALLVSSGTRLEFVLVVLGAGSALGCQFPIAGATGPTGPTAGRLLALDLCGGIIGSVGTALLFVPLLGMRVSSAVLVLAVATCLAGQLAGRVRLRAV